METRKPQDSKAASKPVSEGRRPSLSSSTPATHATLHHALMLEWNQSIQWAFVQARAERAFKQQEEKALLQLRTALDKVLHLNDEVFTKQLELQRNLQLVELDEILASQKEAILPLHEELPHFRQCFHALYNELQNAMQRLEMDGVSFDEEAMLQALAATEDTLHGIIADLRECGDAVVHGAQGTRVMQELLQAERSELVQTAELIKHLSALEVEQRSLTVHHVQMMEEEKRLRGSPGFSESCGRSDLSPAPMHGLVTPAQK